MVLGVLRPNYILPNQKNEKSFEGGASSHCRTQNPQPYLLLYPSTPRTRNPNLVGEERERESLHAHEATGMVTTLRRPFDFTMGQRTLRRRQRSATVPELAHTSAPRSMHLAIQPEFRDHG